MSMISGQVKLAFFIRRWKNGGPVLQKRKKSQSASWTWTRNCIIKTLPLSVCVCLPRVWGTLCVFLFYDRRWDGWGSPLWLTRPVGSIDDMIVHYDVMLMRLLVSNTRWPWFQVPALIQDASWTLTSAYLCPLLQPQTTPVFNLPLPWQPNWYILCWSSETCFKWFTDNMDAHKIMGIHIGCKAKWSGPSVFRLVKADL